MAPSIEMEIADLVEEMMEGKTKPAQLVKIGGALFRRISAHIGADDFNKMQKMAAVNTRTAETAQAGNSPQALHCQDLTFSQQTNSMTCT